MTAPLLIADVPWLLYRSFFGLPRSITDEHGRPVNALLGTINALLLASGARPGIPSARAVVACLGAEQARYRVDLYPAYHAHREPMPDELADQWQLAPALLESFGWTVSNSEELEADDIMHSFALAEARAGGRAALLTGDRDLFQSVGERISILELDKGRVSGEIGPRQVHERYGIGPEQVPDFIALRGDPSDGLPGAPGVGAKTAAALLVEYRTLAGVLDAAHDRASAMRPRIASALRENAQELLAFRQIATLVAVPVQRPKDRPTDRTHGGHAARALGMKRLAERLQGGATA